MATDLMYDLAFQFKETRLWRQMFDSELFAVPFSDGEIGYCCVLGALGEHLALAVYVGDEGYQSLCALRRQYYEPENTLRIETVAAMQSCLQCSYENRDILSPGELEEARAYARSHGRTFRGKNAFPRFTKYRPGYYPWYFDSELDERRICEALRAGIEMSALLEGREKEELGLRSLDEGIQEIPLLRPEGGGWRLEFTRLPPEEIAHPEPAFVNEVLAVRIKRKRKRGSWQCGAMRAPMPVQENEGSGEAPFYPLILFSMDSDTSLLQEPVITDGTDPAEMMNSFAEVLAKAEAAPQAILCADDLCFALLKDLCAKTGIRLEREDDLDVLQEAMEGFLDHVGEFKEQDEEMEELFAMLEQIPDDALPGMPREIRDLLIDLAEEGELPEALEARVRRLLF